MVRTGLPATSGNLVTAHRLAAALAGAGVPAAVLAADALPGLKPPGPGEVVHALHAVAAGLPALRWAAGAPVVWTFTGTDLEAGMAGGLRDAVAAVAAVVAFHAEAAADLRAGLGLPPARLRVIPPGVAAPSGAAPPASRPSRLLFLLPAGLRAVKDPDLALAAAEAARAAGHDVELALAGPARDPDFHGAFLARLARFPGARHLGEVPHAEMPAWYAAADLVLNTSRAEGLSNAVLEAMAAGRAVLATDIPGNRAAIRHGVDGWLAPAAELPAAAARLAGDPELRARLGAAAREAVRARFAPEAELAAHLALYRELVAGGAR